MAEAVVFDIRLGDSFKKLTEVKDSITKLKLANKELNEAVKAGTLTEKQASDARVVNEASMRSLTKQQRRLRQSLDAQATAEKGSINANIVKLRELKDAYQNLAKPTKAQTLEIKELADTINEQKKGISDYTSNIGNYSNSVQDAAKKSGFFARELAILENIQKGVSKVYEQSTNQIRQAAAQYKEAAGTTAEATEETIHNTTAQAVNTTTQTGAAKATGIMAVAQKAMAAATVGSTIAVRLFTAALVATGIGAIIVVLGSLISFLTQTRRGMLLVKQATAVVTSVFNNLRDLLVDLGGNVLKKLAAAFKDPKQAFIDLGNVLKENVLNRLKAFGLAGRAIAKILSGDLKEGFKELGDATLQFGTGVEGATDKIIEMGKKGIDATKDLGKEISDDAKAAASLEKAFEDIGLEAIRLEKRTADARTEVNKLKVISDDVNKSTVERTAAAKKAFEVEEAVEKDKLKLAEENLRLLKLRNSLKESNLDDEKEALQAEADVAKVREESSSRRSELANKLNALLKEGATKQGERDAKALQASDALTAKQQENAAVILKLRDEINQTFLTEIASIEKEAQAFRDAGAAEADVLEFTKNKFEEIEKKKSQILFDELIKRKDEFVAAQDSETTAMLTAFAEQQLAAQGNADELKRIEDEKNAFLLAKTKETIEGQLQILQAELEKATASAEDGIAGTLLSEDDQAALAQRIAELKLQLAELGITIKGLGQDDEGEPFDIVSHLGLDPEKLELAFNIANQITSGLGDIFANLSKNRILDIENERDQLLENAGDDADKKLSIEKNFQNKIDAEKKKGLKRKQKLDIVDATIEMLKGIITAFNTGMQAGLPAGPILAVSLSALAAATGGTQIAAIAKQKFASGGEINVGGELHSRGGTTYVGEDGNMFEVERGEKMYVLNRGASSFVDYLSSINQAFDGASMGTPTKHAQDGGVIDGGFSSRQASGEVQSQIEVAQMISNAVSNIRPQVAVTEINNVNSRLNQAIEISEL